ncbi:hypothetical protein D3C86_2174160 [compost metagenome]
MGLADSYASMRLEIGSAYTIVFFVMIIPLLVLMQALSALGARSRKYVPEAVPAPAVAATPANPHTETRHA